MATNNNIGIINKPYVSSVALVDEREIYNQLVDRQDDAEWTQWMLDMGRNVVAQIPHFDSFYNDDKFIIISTTGATVTGSGTTTITVTNLTSGNNNYIKVGDTILLPNLGVALVKTLTTTTLSNDTFTAQSVNGANLTLVAGNNLSVNGTAMEEASTSPSAMRFNETSIRNLLQIQSAKWTVTDVQKASKRTFEVGGSYKVMPQASMDTLQLLRGRMAASNWSSLASGTLFEDSSPVLAGPNGLGVQTQRGVDSYTTTYGIQPTVTTPGTVTTFDLQTWSDSLTAVKAPSDYMLCGGNSPVTTLSIYLNNLGSSGAQSIRIMKDKNGKDFDFNALSYSFGQFNFTIKAWKILSNPQMFNYDATGSGTKLSIANSLYALPMGKCPLYGGTNGNNGGTTDYWRNRYMESNPGTDGIGGGNLNSMNGFSEILTGGLAPTPTNDTLTLSGRLVANNAIEMFKPQVYAKIKVN